MEKNKIAKTILLVLPSLLIATVIFLKIDSDPPSTKSIGQSDKKILPLAANTPSLASSTQLQTPPVSLPIIEIDDEEALTKNPSYNSIKNWKSAIRNSNHPEDLLFAALTSSELVKHGNFFTRNENLNLQEGFLLQAYSADPDNVLINDKIFDYCLKTPHASICSMPYTESLLQQDGNNAITNLKMAIAFHQRGDIVNAQAFMEKAVITPGYNDYNLKYLRAFDQSYQRFGIERSMSTLIGYFALPFPRVMASYSNMCEQESTTVDGQWKKLCFEVSSRIAKESQTMVWSQIGKSMSIRHSNMDVIESEFYEQAYRGDLHEAREGLQLQAQTFQNKMIAYGGDIPISDEIWENYLALFSKNGEIPAMKYLYDRLLSD